MKKCLLLLCIVMPAFMEGQVTNQNIKLTPTDSIMTAKTDEAVALTQNYRRKRFNRKRRFPLFGERYDSKSCWFSLEVMDSVVKAAHNSTSAKISGIRFYYGLYDKNEKKYKKEHTLVFVPTKDSVQTICAKGMPKDTVYHYDLKDGKSNKFFVYTLNRNEDKQVTRDDTGKVATIAQNHGDMCPPPSPPCKCKGNELGLEPGGSNQDNCIGGRKKGRKNRNPCP